MNLEDIKKEWAKQDEQLSRSLKMNTDLIKKINLEKAKNEFANPLKYEILTITLIIIILIITGVSLPTFLGNTKLFVSGLIVSLLSIVYLILSISKTKKFLELDYYNTPILEIQKLVSNLKLKIWTYRKIELILMPIFIVTIFPISFKLFRNIDVFERFDVLITASTIAILIAIPSVIFINKYLYDKKIDLVSHFLTEVENFEKE